MVLPALGVHATVTRRNAEAHQSYTTPGEIATPSLPQHAAGVCSKAVSVSAHSHTGDPRLAARSWCFPLLVSSLSAGYVTPGLMINPDLA